MGHEQDESGSGGWAGGVFDAATEAAWTRFRVRLADRVDATPACGALMIFVPDPPVQGLRRPGLGVMVEVDDVLTLVIDVDEGCRQEELPRGEVDRAAARVVQVLRDELGQLHPCLLVAEGLEEDQDAASAAWPVAAGESRPEPGAGEEGQADPADRVTTPRDRDHLQELVDAALGRMLGEVRHDPDGDVPIREGASVCWVSVRGDHPVVELFAELVHDPVDPVAVRREVALLNEEHERWKFVVRGEAVVMRTELLALPFCEAQLVVTARLFTEAMDDLARHLVERVGGHRFLEEPEGEETDQPPDQPVDQPGAVPAPVPEDRGALETAGLVELLVLGPVRPATVAGLFGHDRHEIIRQLVAVRTGAAAVLDAAEGAGVDVELVLTALRQALRLVSDGPRPGSGEVGRRRRSVQSALLVDVDPGDDTLDLGWTS